MIRKTETRLHRRTRAALLRYKEADRALGGATPLGDLVAQYAERLLAENIALRTAALIGEQALDLESRNRDTLLQAVEQYRNAGQRVRGVAALLVLGVPEETGA